MSAVGRRLPAYAALVVMSVISLAPLLWIWSQSFRSSEAIASDPVGVEWPLRFSSYVEAWTQARFSDYLVNSVVVAVGTVAIVVTVALPCAYAISLLRLPASRAILLLILLGLMVPVWSIIVPLFYQMRSLGLVNSLLSAMLIEAALGLPFAVFMLRAFLRELPMDLLEAARIDGAGSLRILWSIVCPIAAPAIQAVVVFQFMWSWNELAVPLFFLQADEVRTLPIGLTFFQGRFDTDTAVLAAGTTMASLPVLLVYLLLNRRFVQGLTTGASK